MEFQKIITVGDVINLALLVTVLIGILFTYLQMRINTKTQRAIFFKELYSTMFTDEVIRSIYYKIEYNQFQYNLEFHSGSEEEKSIDRLLSFADLVSELYFQKVISEKEMSFFEYEFIRIFKNSEIKKYLHYLRQFYEANSCCKKPFERFVKYGETHL